MAEVAVAPDARVKAWTYDGLLPGPFIRAKVGDRLIVHFKNELPEPTTVHWHGVRVPIEMDGVPGISQPAVKPGESFVYDFVLRDAGQLIEVALAALGGNAIPGDFAGGVERAVVVQAAGGARISAATELAGAGKHRRPEN